MKYQYISYDVWGNRKDGYEVNQSFLTSYFYEIPDDASDYQINRIIGVQGAVYDGDPNYTLYAKSKKNDRPLFELRAIKE